MITYSDAIRSRSADILSGRSDGDLDAYSRTLVAYLLNTASNTPLALNVRYGTYGSGGWANEDVLAAIVTHLSNVLWDSKHLMHAAAGKRRVAQVDQAIDTAYSVLRDIVLF